MKATTCISLLILCLCGIALALYGIFGVTFSFLPPTLLRSLCAAAGACALWLAFWAIAFRPLKNLH